VPLTVSLAPGDYALVFGTGRFGAASGHNGEMPHDNPDTPQASYFRSFGDAWIDGGFDNTRFVVTGVIVPEPSTIFLLVLSAVTSGVARGIWKQN
jgi:hypothetical protein